MKVNVVHENENYQVLVNDTHDGYLLYNSQTGVTEETNVSNLANAISMAEQTNAYLLYETWKWIRKQEEVNGGLADQQLTLHDLEIN